MQDTINGKVIQGVGGLYRILCEDGMTRECRAKGVLRRDENKLLVGDNVTLLLGKTPADTVVSAISPRKNSLIRPPLANLDLVFLVTAAVDPAPSLDLLDKMTAILTENKIEVILVVTKTDLDPDAAEALAAIYRLAGFPVYPVSSESGDGIAALRAATDTLLAGRTAAFAGASGVGKSTLMNALFPVLRLETGAISEKTARGKHTTRRSDLFPLNGGYLADTPGFSMLDFTRFDFFPLENLPLNFPEFLPYLGTCRYHDCTHTKEEECAIRDAVKQKVIAPSRFESYLSLYYELKAKNPYGK